MDALLGVAAWRRGGVAELAGIVANGMVPGSVVGIEYWYSGERYVVALLKTSMPECTPPGREGGGRACGRRAFAAGIVPYGEGHAPPRPCRKGLYVATFPIRTLAAVETGAEWAVQAECMDSGVPRRERGSMKGFGFSNNGRGGARRLPREAYAGPIVMFEDVNDA